MKDWQRELKSLEDPSRVSKVSQYMQAKESQDSYAKGDLFVGIPVPVQRQFVKTWKDKLTQEDLQECLSSPIHDYRSIGLLVLVEKWKKAKTQDKKEEILSFYKKNIESVNHWDLVDQSAPKIVGGTLFISLPDISFLRELASSDNHWYQRIALVATQYFIKEGFYEPTFELSIMLFSKKHEMVQKALGWMLKEIGDKDQTSAIDFLKKHRKKISSMALTRAIEKYPAELKKSIRES